MYSNAIRTFTGLALSIAPALADDVVHKNDLVLSTLKTSAFQGQEITWQPNIQGMSRYIGAIPTSRINDALRYQDTNALFYSTRFTDLGVELSSNALSSFDFSFGKSHNEVRYSQALNEEFSVTLGFVDAEERAQALLGGEYKFVQQPRAVSAIAIKLTGFNLETSWRKVQLHSSERFETLWHVGAATQGDAFSGSIGRRWFDILPSAHLASSIYATPETIHLATQVEHDNKYLGLTVDPSKTENIRLYFGLTYNFENTQATFTFGNSQKLLQSSLGGLRKANLPNLWRDQILIKARD